MKNSNATHVKPGTAMILDLDIDIIDQDPTFYCFVHSYNRGWATISYDPNDDGVIEQKKVRAKELTTLASDPEGLPEWLFTLVKAAIEANTHVVAGTPMVYMAKDGNYFCYIKSFEKGWAKIVFDPKADALVEEKSVRAKDLAVVTCDHTDLPCWLYAMIGEDALANTASTGLIERIEAVSESLGDTSLDAEDLDATDNIDEDLDAEEGTDLSGGYKRYGRVKFKPVLYSVVKIDGKRHYDVSDETAEDLRGYDRLGLAQILADTLDSTDISFWPKSLKKSWDATEATDTLEFVMEKYGKLNEGMFRMTIGNVIRGINKRQAEEGK